MLSTRLGSSPLIVSRVGLGCVNFGWTLDYAQSRDVIQAAYDSGITFFDTANVYGNHGDSERFLGRAVRGWRDRIVIATKFGAEHLTRPHDGPPRGSPAHIRNAIAASLDRLQTDYIDVYYMHWPDESTPLAETLGALDELVRAGVVRAIGCCNFEPALLEEAGRIVRSDEMTPIVAVQDRYNLLEIGSEQSTLSMSRKLEAGFVPYWPLANGLLTGKYVAGKPPPPGSRLERWLGEQREVLRGAADELLQEEMFDRVARLDAFARAHDRTLLELAIAGLAAQPGVASVTAGATTPSQVRANALAGDWLLSPDEVDDLARL